MGLVNIDTKITGDAKPSVPANAKLTANEVNDLVTNVNANYTKQVEDKAELDPKISSLEDDMSNINDAMTINDTEIAIPSRTLILGSTSDPITVDFINSSASGVTHRFLNFKNSAGDDRIAISYSNSLGQLRFVDVSNNDLMTLSHGGGLNVESLGTGTVYSSGGVLTNTNPSDKRLKNVKGELEIGLTEVLQMKTHRFEYKNDRGREQYGFMAQELRDINKDFVTTFEHTEEDGKKVKRLGLAQPMPNPITVNAMQSQQKQIEELKEQVLQLTELINTLNK